MLEKGYLLHRFSRYRDGRCLLYMIGRLQNGQTFGIVEDRFQASFYIRASEKNMAEPVLAKTSLSLQPSSKTAMDGEELLSLTHADTHKLRRISDKLKEAKVRTYEADVKVEQQFLMDRRLRSLCEIEGNSIPGKGVDRLYKNPTLNPASCTVSLKSVIIELFFDEEKLLAFAISDLPKKAESGEVLIAASDENEQDLLLKFRSALLEIDPDVICAWRVQQDCFLPLRERFMFYNMLFDLGRHRPGQWYIEKGFRGKEFSILQGRQLLDIEELMDHTWERYSESTPESIIKDIFDEDFPSGSPENCASRSLLLGRLLAKKNLVDLTYSRSLLTGLSLERCWGSIASFEYLYIQELHKLNLAAPSVGVDRELRGGSPGGLVLEPHAGIHQNIFVFDFKSLYPSIIRTFNIDPLAYNRARQKEKKGDVEDLIHLPNDVLMDRREAILPATLERLFASREKAKESGDELASFIYKILMNSFFGVLGTSGCRFA